MEKLERTQRNLQQAQQRIRDTSEVLALPPGARSQRETTLRALVEDERQEAGSSFAVIALLASMGAGAFLGVWLHHSIGVRLGIALATYVGGSTAGILTAYTVTQLGVDGEMKKRLRKQLVEQQQALSKAQLDMHMALREVMRLAAMREATSSSTSSVEAQALVSPDAQKQISIMGNTVSVGQVRIPRRLES